MSETYLVVIPQSPDAERPTSAEAAKELLCQLAGTDQGRVKDYGKRQFIDCGEAFDYVACPSCGATLGMKDWHALMDQDWHAEDGFRLHDRVLPCCAAVCTLDGLRYVAPQGFAKWFISAKVVNRGPLTSTEVIRLEDAAGLPLRAIIQHY